jgi:type IV pilus assembly protein PilA
MFPQRSKNKKRKIYMKIFKSKQGFTLIEILLVIAIIAILAAIVIVAINPAKQFRDARNAQRQSDVNTILNAASQYGIANAGALPGPASASIPTLATGETCNVTGANICTTSGAACTGGAIDLSQLVTTNVLVAIPKDPQATAPDSGYKIAQNANGRVVVCAPNALTDGGQNLDITYSR